MSRFSSNLKWELNVINIVKKAQQRLYFLRRLRSFGLTTQVMAELKEMGLSWGEAQASAKDRTLWRSIVVALCPTGDEEDK